VIPKLNLLLVPFVVPLLSERTYPRVSPLTELPSTHLPFLYLSLLRCSPTHPPPLPLPPLLPSALFHLALDQRRADRRPWRRRLGGFCPSINGHQARKLGGRYEDQDGCSEGSRGPAGADLSEPARKGDWCGAAGFGVDVAEDEIEGLELSPVGLRGRW
jgi:hypothetical protein